MSTGAPGPAPSSAAPSLGAIRWALLAGNFVIGCGVMVVAGTLNDMAASLDVSVAVAGQLIAIAAAVMAFGAPALAAAVSGWDRRRLLALALVWYGLGHLACAAMPHYAALWPVRAATMLAAAVFTPQAAAAVGFLAPPAQRGRSITFVFLGWSLASVAGMPLAAWIGGTFGWRVAMAGVGALSALAALSVWLALPDGVRPPGLSLRAWRGVFANRVLMAMVTVTALLSAGQFTLFSYFAPYYHRTLGATPADISLLFAWFGAFGLAGNVVVTRVIDRVPIGRLVAVLIAMMALSLALWPLATSTLTMMLVLVPWGLSCFASNSSQQARLGAAAPALAPALMALNTSAIYLGQAVGAAGGGSLVALAGFGSLSWVGLAWVLVALALSQWAAGRSSQALTAGRG